MTPYATVQDCIDRRGARAVELLRDKADADGPLERALEDASAEIDGYVGARHALPLDPAPPILKALCVDIAMLRASPDAGKLTEEDQRRSEAAVRLLRDISRGTVSLGAKDPDPPAEAASPSVRIDAPDRVMTRRSLRGIL